MKEEFIVDMLTMSLNEPITRVAEKLAQKYGYRNGSSANGTFRSEAIRNPNAIGNVVKRLIKEGKPFRVNTTVASAMKTLNITIGGKDAMPGDLIVFEEVPGPVSIPEEDNPEDRIMEHMSNILHSTSSIQGFDVESFLSGMSEVLSNSTKNLEVNRFTAEIQRLHEELDKVRSYSSSLSKEVEELKTAPAPQTDELEKAKTSLQHVRRLILEFKGLPLNERMRRVNDLSRSILSLTDF